MDINEVFKIMIQKQASDLFIRLGAYPSARINGVVEKIYDELVDQQAMDAVLEQVLVVDKKRKALEENGDVDLVYALDGIGRFRINVFQQRGTPSFVARHVHTQTKTFEDLNLPKEILEHICQEKQGMFLACGPAGNGKSTALATMIQYINETKARHIITFEDPIEYMFKDAKSLISQRELGLDFETYPKALRAVTQQSPDVIYIGNIRDHDTMKAAITASELGTFVMSTFHTINAVQTLTRIFSFFPPHAQEEIRDQVAGLLKGMLCLRLVPTKDGEGRVPVYEVLVNTPTIAGLIREGRIREIQNYINQGEMFGMVSFGQSLVKAVRNGFIEADVAREYADSKSEFDMAIKGIKL